MIVSETCSLFKSGDITNSLAGRKQEGGVLQPFIFLNHIKTKSFVI